MISIKNRDALAGFQALKALDGNTNDLSFGDDPRKKILLFVLSTTCPHCEKNLVHWKAIVEKHGNDNNCMIIGLSIHPIGETITYARDKQLPFYVASVGADTSFSRKFKIPGVPETILLTGDGTVEHTWVGELSEEQTKEIQTLMGA